MQHKELFVEQFQEWFGLSKDGSFARLSCSFGTHSENYPQQHFHPRNKQNMLRTTLQNVFNRYPNLIYLFYLYGGPLYLCFYKFPDVDPIRTAKFPIRGRMFPPLLILHVHSVATSSPHRRRLDKVGNPGRTIDIEPCFCFLRA